MNSPNKATIIIGAGPAGLTAAYELQKLGKPSTILEAERQVGGISKTVLYRGSRFDIGGHRFFSKVPYINQIWNEILGDDFLECSRLSRIHYKGTFFDYPLKPINALQGLGLLETFRVGWSYAKVHLRPSSQDTELNFEQWVSSRFGVRLYEIFFKTYTEKVWGMPCNEISADWAAQRIKNLSLGETIKNAIFNNNKAQDGEILTTLIEKFHYPRLGPGMMWERCQQLLEKANNHTLFKQKVTAIHHHQHKIYSLTCEGGLGELSHYSGDEFISTMPLRNLVLALNPPAPNKVMQAAKKLRYRDYLTIVLVINKPNIFPDNWIYIHTPEVKLGRIQNYKNWSKEMVSDPNITTLGLEYFLWENEEEWSWSDERFINFGIQECVKLGFIKTADVLDGTVVRMKKAYPIYDHQYQQSLKIIQSYLATFSNLQTIGRNGLHRYNNQDHSMLTGIYAARNIVNANYDVWKVNVEKDYHEKGFHPSHNNGNRLVPASRIKKNAKSLID